MPKNSILSTRSLAIGYPLKSKDIIVANDINFTLGQGELIGLIGINGSGKSTLLRTLSGVQKQLSGEVLISRQPIERYDSRDLSKHVSLVLTNQAISKNLTVKELIALGRQPYTNWIGTLSQDDKIMVNRALQLTGLEDLAHKHCHELSDGQLQITLIARALAQDTPIIILDEPTTHLDLHHQAHVFQLLKNMTTQLQKTIIFATHEINLALPLCDTLVLINKGEVTSGTTQELIEQNALEDIFPSDLVQFDKSIEQFKVTTR